MMRPVINTSVVRNNFGLMVLISFYSLSIILGQSELNYAVIENFNLKTVSRGTLTLCRILRNEHLFQQPGCI